MKTFLYQKISSPLCILLIGLMTFWTVLYYFTHKAEAIGNNLAIDSEVLNELSPRVVPVLDTKSASKK